MTSLLTLLIPALALTLIVYAAYLLGLRHGYDDGVEATYRAVEAWQKRRGR